MVHELRDPDGHVFTFFCADVTMLETTGIDYTKLGVFATMPIPAGWSYSSRVLEDRLVLRTTDVAIAYKQLQHSLWELTADGDATPPTETATPPPPTTPPRHLPPTRSQPRWASM